MLHSVLVLNDDNYVLLARYFQPTTSLDARKRFEAQLARICAQQLPQCWAKPAPGSVASSSAAVDHLLCCEQQFVVLRQIGELRVLFAGSDEYDELILAEIMSLFHAVLVTQLEKKLTEASLLVNYAKVVAALDEMVQQGHLENADEASVEQMSKLRPYPVK